MRWWERKDAPVLGRYRIDRLLGEGGMARVFLATDLRNDRLVAFKTPKLESFPPEFVTELLARFTREFRAQAQDPIQGVIPIHESGEFTDDEGVVRPFLVMQYLSGGSLGDLLGGDIGRRAHRQTLAEVLDWLVPIARTVDRLHARKYLHRDIKPDNILFNSDGDPFLADFGVVGSLDPSLDGATLSSGTMSVLSSPGSPGYQSPESIQADPALRNVSASDQFSLAVTVYEALAGVLPVRVSTHQQWFGALMHWAPIPLSEPCPELPPAAVAAVARALTGEARERFPSCSEFARAMAAAAAGADAPRPAAPPVAAAVAASTPSAMPRDRDAPHAHAAPAAPPASAPIAAAAPVAAPPARRRLLAVAGIAALLAIAALAWMVLPDRGDDATSVATEAASRPGAAPSTPADARGAAPDAAPAAPAPVGATGATTPVDSSASVVPDTTLAASGPDCKADADGDRSNDCEDKCPGTRGDDAVDATGCPRRRDRNTEVVFFRADRSNLDPEHALVLDEVVGTMKADPQWRVTVVGHADPTEGSAPVAMGISQRRANSVSDYLTAQGVDGARVSTEWRGTSAPEGRSLDANGARNVAGISRNRRVELRLRREATPPPAPQPEPVPTQRPEVEIGRQEWSGTRFHAQVKGDRLVIRSVGPPNITLIYAFDADGNGRVDPAVDVHFGFHVNGVLCPAKWVTLASSSHCGTLQSGARGSQSQVGGMQVRHLDLPIREVSRNGRTVQMRVEIYDLSVTAPRAETHWLSYSLETGLARRMPAMQ